MPNAPVVEPPRKLLGPPPPPPSSMIPKLPRGVMGQGCVCVPSYVVTTIVGSSQDLSTLFFTPHAVLVHR
ncbi:hypothetical protein C2S52_005701 [Perilla frutescens var. hirtella]|uniref:Uncharacterized protein n=1 Tax=Perilla frutescens var. hirtella TaxID=608512 RepID=A0AAD4JH98_PERFH|nr:hypothetical protein C2S51_010032 [Perilla frutescens var. frutescens]KAH6788339.1 hypothetical protein C2S51_003345 [Perilla frutescens var. frutescens]KAH6795224.1 hypothetical protein C2S52_005701 [Perilla frutescens var. hirtella]KAH6833070.1 hypothetical protein C2S53_005018 [Perilla frutescens var. hirtella]